MSRFFASFSVLGLLVLLPMYTGSSGRASSLYTFTIINVARHRDGDETRWVLLGFQAVATVCTYGFIRLQWRSMQLFKLAGTKFRMILAIREFC